MQLFCTGSLKKYPFELFLVVKMDGNDHKKLKKSPKENIFFKNIVLKEEKKGGLTILFSLFHYLSLMPHK